MNVSIDMSKDDETAQNRIFAEVVEKQTTNDGDVTLLCDFDGANYDFDNHRKISELQSKLDIAVKAINSAATYLTCMDDLSELNNGKCNEQMALEELNKAIEQIKELEK